MRTIQRRQMVPVMLCGVSVGLAFVPLMRLADDEGRQGLLFALTVCGTYGAGARLLIARPSWRTWALVVVAGAGMGVAVADFLSSLPAVTQWAAAVLVPGTPTLVLAARVTEPRRHELRPPET